MNKISAPVILISTLLISFQGIAQIADSVKTPDSAVVMVSSPLTERSKLRTFIPAAVAVTYGFVALNSTWLRKLDTHIYNNTNSRHPNFDTPIDDYLRYVPFAAVYGLGFAGVKGKNNFADKTALFFITSVITGGTVAVLKRSSNRMRPNHYNDYSFPSGHAATAFAAAEYLHQEYGEQSVWYSIAGYTAATATGVSRLYRNYHWFSDVVAGAGIGILSTKVTYLIYPSIKRMFAGNKKTGLTFVPVYQEGTFGMAFSAKL